MALCALALLQYHWINQVTEAQRQRAKASLAASLSALENDFDIEITRAFVAFQIPGQNSGDYAERYREWVRGAPYPNLIRGVYIAESGPSSTTPKAVVPPEPAISSAEWKRDGAKMALPFAGLAMSSPGLGSRFGLQVLSRGRFTSSFGSPAPQMMIGGNPAFVFPIIPRDAGFVTRSVRVAGTDPTFRGGATVSGFGPIGPSQWAVVVLDSEYMRTTFLPKLVQLHFSNASPSDYAIVVLNKDSVESPRLVFRSEQAPPETEFANPDGRTNLFELRLDCFSQPLAAGPVRVIQKSPGLRGISAESLAEILVRKPPACGNPATGSDSTALWQMLIKDRAGSLDQAMATFRNRNLLLSGSVLLVLALGILVLAISSERARALAEMQTEFVLGVSHELRTPLTVIRVAADNLRKGIVEIPEQAHKYGEIIHSRASELSDMIEETLSFARIHSPALDRRRVLVAPEEIVKAALADSEDVLRQAGLAVELDLAPDLPLVSADVRLVKRCLENLFQNAAKYAASGQWMAVRVKAANVRAGEGVLILVEDRGPGISAVDLPHVFEPFYRSKDDDVSQVPGIGLGLTFVKRVIEAHRGIVEAKDSRSAGAVFSIFLPRQDARSQAIKMR